MNIKNVLENELHLNGKLLEEVYEYIKEKNYPLLGVKDGVAVFNVPHEVTCRLAWEEGNFTILEFQKCLDQSSALFGLRLAKSVEMNENYFKLIMYTVYDQQEKIRFTISHGDSIPAYGIYETKKIEETKRNTSSFDVNGIEYSNLNAKVNYLQAKMENYVKENIKNR